MARITFKDGDEYADRLLRLASGSEEVAKKAIYAGAKIVTDKVRANLEALPEESFRRLRGEDSFSGLPEAHKEDLMVSFGITPITEDRSGFWNAKIGFDGYGRFPTKTYPHGLPNQLLARAIESGSSVRQKRPFVAPAVRATRKAAVEAMGRVLDEEIKKNMKG